MKNKRYTSYSEDYKEWTIDGVIRHSEREGDNGIKIIDYDENGRVEHIKAIGGNTFLQDMYYGGDIYEKILKNGIICETRETKKFNSFTFIYKRIYEDNDLVGRSYEIKSNYENLHLQYRFTFDSKYNLKFFIVDDLNINEPIYYTNYKKLHLDENITHNKIENMLETWFDDNHHLICIRDLRLNETYYL